jgi:hypothetical protein
VWLEGLGKSKNPVASSRFEPAGSSKIVLFHSSSHSVRYCDMFEVTSRKHLSTKLAEDFCYKMWIVEARGRGNAETILSHIPGMCVVV